jgi:hypothetical protein
VIVAWLLLVFIVCLAAFCALGLNAHLAHFADDDDDLGGV